MPGKTTCLKSVSLAVYRRELIMEYEKIIELLPLYLNDQLSVEQIKLVRRMVDDSQSLQEELIFLQSIKHSIKSENIKSPGEWGFMRLKHDILAEESRSEHITPSDVEKNKQGWWQKIAIAASFAFVIQSGYIIQKYSIQPERYHTLSAIELKNAVKVKFMAGVSESDIRTLLINLEGNIVKGPSAVGIYYIIFEDRQSAVVSLNTSGLFEYAELTQE